MAKKTAEKPVKKTVKRAVKTAVKKTPAPSRASKGANAAKKALKKAPPPSPKPMATGGGKKPLGTHGRLIPLHILSDSTGNLAQHMLTAFLTQFPSDAFVLRPQNFLQTPARLRVALDHVAEEPGIVCHAMVSSEAKGTIASRCDELGLPQCDLTGDFVHFLSRVSGIAPSADVEALHDTSNLYHERIKALEFTLEHDDGLGLETLHRADIVLAGVSRTSKTPTSIYLAQQGHKVANVSLAMGIEPPKQLLELKRNVVGLLIEPHQLVEIRTNRSIGWRMGDTRYNDPDHVDREVLWSKRLFARHGWPTLDVTDQAVEETAARIVNLIAARRPVGR